MLIHASTSHTLISFCRNKLSTQSADRLFLTKPDVSIGRNWIYSLLQTKNLKLIYLQISISRKSQYNDPLPYSHVYNFYTDLPPDAQLHDLASLTALDAKQLDVAQLRADAIKEQQVANLKHSSSECAILPEDHAQTMLAGVCFLYASERAPSFDTTQHALECEIKQLIIFIIHRQ